MNHYRYASYTYPCTCARTCLVLPSRGFDTRSCCGIGRVFVKKPTMLNLCATVAVGWMAVWHAKPPSKLLIRGFPVCWFPKAKSSRLAPHDASLWRPGQPDGAAPQPGCEACAPVCASFVQFSVPHDRTSPAEIVVVHRFDPHAASGGGRGRRSFDPPQDAGEQRAWHRHLGQLEHHIAAGAHGHPLSDDALNRLRPDLPGRLPPPTTPRDRRLLRRAAPGRSLRQERRLERTSWLPPQGITASVAAFLAAATGSHAAVSAAREYPVIWAEAQLFCAFCPRALCATDVMGLVFAPAARKYRPPARRTIATGRSP